LALMATAGWVQEMARPRSTRSKRIESDLQFLR
jgi:hypothetical protein